MLLSVICSLHWCKSAAWVWWSVCVDFRWRCVETPQISFFPFEQKTVISNIPQACCMWNCQLFFLKVMHCFVHTAHSGTQINHLCAWFFFSFLHATCQLCIHQQKLLWKKRRKFLVLLCVSVVLWKIYRADWDCSLLRVKTWPWSL